MSQRSQLNPLQAARKPRLGRASGDLPLRPRSAPDETNPPRPARARCAGSVPALLLLSVAGGVRVLLLVVDEHGVVLALDLDLVLVLLRHRRGELQRTAVELADAGRVGLRFGSAGGSCGTDLPEPAEARLELLGHLAQALLLGGADLRRRGLGGLGGRALAEAAEVVRVGLRLAAPAVTGADQPAED